MGNFGVGMDESCELFLVGICLKYLGLLNYLNDWRLRVCKISLKGFYVCSNVTF